MNKNPSKMHLLLTFVQCFSLIVLTSTSANSTNLYENGTASSLMFLSDDIQCLTQMPLTELIKIQRTIASLHVVSDYDAKQITSNSQNQSEIELSELREAPESEAEERTLFHYFKWKTTTKSPLAASLMSTSNAYGMIYPNGLRHKYGYPMTGGWEEERPSKIQKVLHFSLTALSFLAFAGYLLCMIVQAIKSKAGTTYLHSGMMQMETMPVVMAGSQTVNRITGIRPLRFRRNTKFATVAEPDPVSLFRVLESVAKGYVQLNQISFSPT